RGPNSPEADRTPQPPRQWHGGALQQLRERPQLRRSRRAPALWRRGEVQLDRLAAGTRARRGGGLSGAGPKDQHRDPLRAADTAPGAEHPAARAVASRLVRCQSEALAHHTSTLAAARRAVNLLTQEFRASGPRQWRGGLIPRRQLLANAAIAAWRVAS